jgi:hypothetical protein
MVYLNQEVCKVLLIGLLSLLPFNAIAQELLESSLCPIKELQSKQEAVRVWQYKFEDGIFDLVMAPVINKESSPVIRLSFGGSKEAKCHFPEVSVLKGGDWGWHVAWTSVSQQAVFYARVDAEAWVSSPPKKMDYKVADVIQLFNAHGTLLLQYHLRDTPSHNSHTLASDDEGRNFSVLDKK